MSSIGFVVHPGESEVVVAAVEAAAELGYTTWTVEQGAAEAFNAHAADTVLLVTVGGDGTFLLGARLGAPHETPVLGVNRGRLGFLTDVELAELPMAIGAFHDGRITLQRRSMLRAGVGHTDFLALNDVVVKSADVAVVRLEIQADGELLGTFDADGVVVATATGSTAYALSAGGPLVDPRLRASVVVPLAPHAVITRALVVPDSTPFWITVKYGHPIVAADGIFCGDVKEGDMIRVEPGPDAQVVRLDNSPQFAQRVRDKLHFGMPLKTGRDREGADGTA